MSESSLARVRRATPTQVAFASPANPFHPALPNSHPLSWPSVKRNTSRLLSLKGKPNFSPRGLDEELEFLKTFLEAEHPYLSYSEGRPFPSHNASSASPYFLFRARVHPPPSKLLATRDEPFYIEGENSFVKDPRKELWYPPKEIQIDGRVDHRTESVLYTSNSRDCVFHETNVVKSNTEVIVSLAKIGFRRPPQEGSSSSGPGTISNATSEPVSLNVAYHGWHWKESNESKCFEWGQVARAYKRLERAIPLGELLLWRQKNRLLRQIFLAETGGVATSALVNLLWNYPGIDSRPIEAIAYPSAKARKPGARDFTNFAIRASIADSKLQLINVATLRVKSGTIEQVLKEENFVTDSFEPQS